MARNGEAPRGKGEAGDEVSGDRVSQHENPEMPESSAANRAPEDDYGHGRENGNNDREPENRSQGDGSPKNNAAQNGDGNKSPRYSSQERRSERGSRRASGENFDEGEDRRAPRRRDSRSNSPMGSRSPRRRSRSGSDRNRRDRDAGSKERQDKGPFTQVYVTGFSRTSRREDIEAHFSRGRDNIQHVIMKSRFAFIDFRNPEDAAEAVTRLDNSEFEGRKLVVQQSYPDGSKRRARTTGPQSVDECWTCGKKGHWANDCEQRGRGGGDRRGGRDGDRGGRDDRRRSPGRSYNRKSRSPPRRSYQRRSRSRSRDDGRSKELREGRCFICNEKGHIKRDCPQSRGGNNDRRPTDRRSGRDDFRGGNRDRFHHRRSNSRSRSPRGDYGGRRGGRDMGERMRSPPRRQYSRSPPQQQADRYRGGDREQSRD